VAGRHGRRIGIEKGARFDSSVWSRDHPTMPWTFYRYILREVLKLLLISGAVLVLMISVFAAIKPLSDGLLPASSLIRFVGYTAPTMLGFALPFAAAFASTLVFVRLSSDREIIAAMASGMSHAMILLPIVGLGLILTMAMYGLSNFVIPVFYQQAERTLQRDVMSVLVSRLNRNEPFEMGNMVLYADEASQAEPPKLEGVAIQPHRFVQLRGVAVGELGKDGRMMSDTTAGRANVLLFRDPESRQGIVTIRLRDVVYSREGVGQGDLFATDQMDLSAIKLPSPLKDSTKFMSWLELRRLVGEPERYDTIAVEKDALRKAIVGWILRDRIVDGLSSGGRISLYGALPGERYELQAPRIRSEDLSVILLANGSDEVRMTEYRGSDVPSRKLAAGAVKLDISTGAAALEPTMSVELGQATVTDVRRANSTQHTTLRLPPMAWPEPIVGQPMLDATLWELRSFAASLSQSNGNVPDAVSLAQKEIDESLSNLDIRVRTEWSARAAAAFTAGLVLLLGATVSIERGNSMPLVIYLRVFLIAVLAVLLAAGGENLAVNRQMNLPGALAMLWSGNLMLLVLVVWSYLALRRV